MTGACYICWTPKDEDNTLKHLSLYVCGSEGVEVCFSCEMALVETIKNMARAAAKSRKFVYKATKKLRKEKVPETN